MKEERVIELAKTARIVSETYDAHTGNWSWPRLKAFVDLIESDIRAELTPRKLPNVKPLEELARDEGDRPETSAYTPGPWEAVVGNDDRLKNNTNNTNKERRYFPHVIMGTGAWQGRLVINEGGGPMEEHDANARLIAAAPDLLDALKRLRKAETAPRVEWMASLENADTAIAKATGEK